MKIINSKGVYQGCFLVKELQLDIQVGKRIILRSNLISRYPNLIQPKKVCIIEATYFPFSGRKTEK